MRKRKRQLIVWPNELLFIIKSVSKLALKQFICNIEQDVFSMELKAANNKTI